MRLRVSMTVLFLAASILPLTREAQAAESPAARPSGKPDAAHSSASGSAIPGQAPHHFREGHPTIFMAWGAPWGTPGARDSAVWACDDTLAADTLYLTFDPGEDITILMGIDATLVFHAAPGDTLGPFWDLSRKGVNPYNLRIEFDPPPEGTPNPWPLLGVAYPRYEVKGDTGRLDLTYFVQASKGGPVYAGTRYFFARVMIRMRKPYLSGCRQPVCADFDHLLVTDTDGSRWINAGERFASWNSAGGGACRECRKRPPSEEPPRFGGRYDLKQAPGETIPAARDTTSRR